MFRRRSKKTSKLRVTGICVGNSQVTGEFPTQKASNAENVSIWRRHHDICVTMPELLESYISVSKSVCIIAKLNYTLKTKY